MLMEGGEGMCWVSGERKQVRQEISKCVEKIRKY